MIRRSASLAVALAILLLGGLIVGQRGAGGVTVSVSARSDSAGRWAGNMLYTATFVNGGAKALVLKAEQSPGGYVGSGTFFGCSLEQWEGLSRPWRTVIPVKRDLQVTGEPVSLTDVSVAPGVRREVCRLLLPVWGGEHGARVRVRVWRSLDTVNDGVSWVSEPFLIHPKPGK